MSQLFDKTINVLSTAMDMYMLRHTVITDNIANAETPNFKARRVDFEAQLQGVIDKEKNQVIESEGGITRSLASVRPMIYEDPHAEIGQDTNSVDMDREMARLKKNELKFSATSESISKKFALLKCAITEGNR